MTKFLRERRKTVIINLLFDAAFPGRPQGGTSVNRQYSPRTGRAVRAALHREQHLRREQQRVLEELGRKAEQQKELLLQTIATIINAVDAKDEYTDGHSRRVAEYSRKLALEVGKSQEEADWIHHIALLHDIGKIGVPDALLKKPDKLTPQEVLIFRTHCEIGANILKDLTFYPGLEVGALYHHERYDGQGYPYGLKGEEIPEVARLIGVADTFDAMNSDRVYQKAYDRAYIRREILTCSGAQFDPVFATALVRLLDEGRLLEEDTQNS